MERITFSFCMLISFISLAMDAPLTRRRSSSGRSHTLLARHNSKANETKDCSRNLDPLVTSKSQEQSLSQDSKKSDSLPRSNSKNWIEKAGEKNRKQWIIIRARAFMSIKNIEAENDHAHLEYLSHLKYAEHFLRSEICLEITPDPLAIENLIEEEFKELKVAFNEKIASITAQKK